MKITSCVYSSAVEIEAARSKVAAQAWARAALDGLIGRRAARNSRGMAEDAWCWALAGTIAERHDVLRRAADALCEQRDLVAGCGGSPLETGWALNPYIGAFELVRDLVPASEQRRILGMLRSAAEKLRDSPRGDSNQQNVHNAGMLGFGLLVGEPAWVTRAVEDERQGFLHHLRCGVRREGQWWEGTPGYHLNVVIHLQMNAELLRRAGHDLYRDPEFAAIFRSTYDVLLRAVTPAMTVFGKNDGGTLWLPEWASVFEIGYARFRDPGYGWILKHGERISPLALLYGEPEVTGTAPPVDSNVLATVGWAVMRAPRNERYWQEGLCAMLDFGPHGGWHGHPDALSLDLYALGQELLRDAGMAPAGYGIREHWDWYRHTLGHNTVTVDGLQQMFVYGDDDAAAEAGSGGRVTFDALATDLQVIETLDEAAYPGADYQRAVVVVGQDYLVDFFRVALPGEHVFDYALHGVGQLALDRPMAPMRERFRPTSQPPPNREAHEIPWTRVQDAAREWRAPEQDPHAAYDYAHEVYGCDIETPVRAVFHGGMAGDGRFFPGGPGLAIHLLPADATWRVFTCRTPRSRSFAPTLVVRSHGSAAYFSSVMVPFFAAPTDAEQYQRFGKLPVAPVTLPCAVQQVRLGAFGSDFRCVVVDTDAGRDVIMHTFDVQATALVDEPAILFEGKFCCLRFDGDQQLRSVQIFGGRRLVVAGKAVFEAPDGCPAAYAWSAGADNPA